MEQSAVKIFGEKISALKKQGLKDIKFSVDNISEMTTPEQFCEEANRFLDAMANDEGEPLNFNDSRRL